MEGLVMLWFQSCCQKDLGRYWQSFSLAVIMGFGERERERERERDDDSISKEEDVTKFEPDCIDTL